MDAESYTGIHMTLETEDTPTTTNSDVELAPKLSPRWALAPRHLAIVGFWCIFFLVLNYLPLRPTDLWGHTAFGSWILEHRQLPTEDPYQPLAAGVTVVDSAWLSQVIYAVIERSYGGEGLSGVFALCTLLTFLVLARTCYLQSRQILPSFLGVILAMIVGWSRLATIRPENFALLCFAVLIWLVVSSVDKGARPGMPQERQLRLWIGIPLVMMLWANLHGSFLCGLAFLGCYFAGSVIETGWRTRRWRAVADDANVRRWLYLCELAVLSTLLNPYGVDLLLYTSLFGGNDNLRDILEWQPLVILGVGGREFALSWVILLFLFRHSLRRVSVTHVLLLGVFGLAVAYGVRMVSWYSFVLAIVAMPHIADLWSRFRPAWGGVPEVQPSLAPDVGSRFVLSSGRRWSYSLVALLLIWIAAVLSPLARPVRGDTPREPAQLFDESTPLKLSEHLRSKSLQGQMFNPQWWGDWLVWDGSAGLEPFVTTNIHLVPRQVWQDYQRIMGTRPGWQRALDRYDVQVVVLDKERQTTLARQLRRSADWRLDYEDDQAMMFKRRHPVFDAAQSETASPVNPETTGDPTPVEDTPTPDEEPDPQAAREGASL